MASSTEWGQIKYFCPSLTHYEHTSGRGDFGRSNPAVLERGRNAARCGVFP